MDHFDAIARQRRALADTLATLSPEQWRTASLCDGWTVHDVAAHLVTPHETSIVRAIVTIAGSRGDFASANRKMTARLARLSSDELVRRLRQHAEGRFTPPGFDSIAPLADVYIHGRDMLDPLGLPDTGDAANWLHVATFLASARARRGFVGAALPEVHFCATDSSFDCGAGPDVHGTTADLAMTIAGRPVSEGALSGEGVPVVAKWVAARRRG